MAYQDVGWCFTKHAVTYIYTDKTIHVYCILKVAERGKKDCLANNEVFWFFLKTDSFKYSYAVANIFLRFMLFKQLKKYFQTDELNMISFISANHCKVKNVNPNCRLYYTYILSSFI